VNDLERFRAVCNFAKPDYVPIFGFPGSQGMSGGCMQKTWDRLVDQGMPDWVDGCGTIGEKTIVDTWHRYWGTTGPIALDVLAGEPATGVSSETRIDGEWEIIEYDTGAVTRQVLDNDVTYSMPDFITPHIRDRKSWEFFRDRVSPGKPWSQDRLDAECARFDSRERPLAITVNGAWGGMRGLLGAEAACTVLYDDPTLAHEIIDWFQWLNENYVFPLIERLRPECVGTSEDCCYKGGMLVSPAQFEEFSGAYYRRLTEVTSHNGVTMTHVDTDGNAMEFTGLVRRFGINAIHPYEVKAGNDLFALREQYPDFVLMGWLEKEVVNEGNEHFIADELMSKVPRLLERGGYFPNGDHGLQPMVTFKGMCKFMTLLHELCDSPEGEFPRMGPND